MLIELFSFFGVVGWSRLVAFLLEWVFPIFCSVALLRVTWLQDRRLDELTEMLAELWDIVRQQHSVIGDVTDVLRALSDLIEGDDDSDG